MTDLYVSLGTIKRIVRKGHYHYLFESKGYVIASLAGITLIARKKTPNRIFSQAYPFYSAGYTSISSWDDEVPRLSLEEIIDEIKAILDSLPADSKEQALKEIGLTEEMKEQ